MNQNQRVRQLTELIKVIKNQAKRKQSEIDELEKKSAQKESYHQSEGMKTSRQIANRQRQNLEIQKRRNELISDIEKCFPLPISSPVRSTSSNFRDLFQIIFLIQGDYRVKFLNPFVGD
jgi:hypothetical protein